jgi:hypothetical protein
MKTRIGFTTETRRRTEITEVRKGKRWKDYNPIPPLSHLSVLSSSLRGCLSLF